jgi:tripeptidyl-peptidase I
LYTNFYVYGSQDKSEGQHNDKRNGMESNGKDKSMSTTTRAMANDERIRTLQYSVPPVVAEHILLIQPTTRFGHVKAHSSDIFSTARGPLADHQQKVNDLPSLSRNTTACSSSITPECLRALYNIGDYTADPSCGSLFGVTGYSNELASYDDLKTFL